MSISLYVVNLPKETTNEEIQAIFAEAGDSVLSATVILSNGPGKCQGYGFVTVRTEEEATEVIEKFNGYVFKGNPLNVSKYQPKSEQKGTPTDDTPTKKKRRRKRKSGSDGAEDTKLGENQRIRSKDNEAWYWQRLKQIWQWLVRQFDHFLAAFRSPSEYDSCFRQLLEGVVNQGWQQEQILAYLGERRIKERWLVSWLKNWEKELLTSPAPNYELARRMVYLAEMECGELGEVALEISKKLLGRELPHNEVTSADSVENLLNQGLCQFYRGHYQPSINIFQQASEIDPQNPLIWFRLGLACYLLEEYEKAIKHLSQALEIKQSYTLARALRGWAYNKLNETENARADFNQARDFQQVIPTEQQSYEDWQGQCIALDGLFDIDKLSCDQEALDTYNRATQLKSDSCEVWLSCGIIRANLGDNEIAIGYYNQAIRLQPDYQEAWRRRSIALSHINEQKNAIVSSEIALAINPDSYKTWCSLGIAQSHLGEQEQAIRSYDKAIQLKANYAKAWYNRGNAWKHYLEHPNRREEAIKSYEKATEHKPDYVEAWCTLGLMQEHLKNEPHHYSKALKTYEKALEYLPDSSEYWYRRGNVLERLNRNKEALESYDRAIERDPNYSDAREKRITLLRTLFKAGRHTEVISSCKKNLKIIPYDPENHQILADSLMRLDWNNLRKALDHYEQAIALGLNSAQVWCGKGKALQQLARYQEAVESYKKALELDKQCWEAYDGYGWTCYKLRQPNKALANWNKGIQALEVTSYNDERERGLGELHYSKGRYYHDRDNLIFLNRQEAKKSYKSAIQHFKNTLLLEREVEVWQNLLEVYQDLPLRKDQQKQELRADLLEGTERYEQLLKKKEKDDSRLEKKFAEFSQLSVDTFAKLGDQNEALKVAEQRKNLCLSWFTPGKRETDIESWNYQEIQDILLNEETAAIDWHISPTAITTFILWHNKKYPLLLRGNSDNYLASERLQDFKDWMVAWKKDYQKYKQIKEKEEKQNHYWQKLMWDRLNNLANILDTPRLLEHLAKAGIKQLILIPHRDLHLLPLHVLFYPPYTNLDYTITYLPSAQIGVDLKRLKANSEQLPQAPSMLIVERPDTEKKSEPSSLLDLLYSELEANVIAQQYHCPDKNRITGKNATQEQVINGLKTNADIFHFTGHAYHNVREPRNSFLALANNERLTMQDISNNFAKLGLSSYYLAALSACETGMSGNSGLIDEFVSLASGFLAVGTTYVISTLWEVNEIPAALLMIQFFQNLKVNSNPPLALKEAQDWLRTLTYAKLAEWYRDLSTKQENSGNLVYSQQLKSLADNAQERYENLAEQEAEKKLLVNAMYNLREWNQRFSNPSLRHLSPKLFLSLAGLQVYSAIAKKTVYNTDRLISNCPFEHPDDWAGFIITGQATTQPSTIPYVN